MKPFLATSVVTLSILLSANLNADLPVDQVVQNALTDCEKTAPDSVAMCLDERTTQVIQYFETYALNIIQKNDLLNPKFLTVQKQIAGTRTATDAKRAHCGLNNRALTVEYAKCQLTASLEGTRELEKNFPPSQYQFNE